MRAVGAGLLGAVLIACGAAVGASPLGLPVLTAAVVEQLLLNADDARRQAVDAAQPLPDLSLTFGGGALDLHRRLAAELRRRGESRQERPALRRLVHWSDASQGVAAEGVLEVRAEQRSSVAGLPESPWTHTVRQWWARLGGSGAGWRIVEDQDLAPDHWWRA